MDVRMTRRYPSIVIPKLKMTRPPPQYSRPLLSSIRAHSVSCFLPGKHPQLSGNLLDPCSTQIPNPHKGASNPDLLESRAGSAPPPGPVCRRPPEAPG